MRGHVIAVLLGGAAARLRELEESRQPGRARSRGPADQARQRLALLSAARSAWPQATRCHLSERWLSRRPGDSVITRLGLSLENRALAFQREGNLFVAHYRVSISFQARRALVRWSSHRDEIVRVPTFQETLRADESVLFQQILRLTPGPYKVSVTVRDAGSTRREPSPGDYTAPSFQPGTTSAPILAYQATGRASRSEPLSVVLNSRGAVGYGADTLLAYIEGYDFHGTDDGPLRGAWTNSRTSSIPTPCGSGAAGKWRARSSASLPTASRWESSSSWSGAVPLNAASRRWSRSPKRGSSPTSTRCWTSCATSVRMPGQRDAEGACRRAVPALAGVLRQDRPQLATPENEALNQYFGRIGAANTRFTDEGVPGWRTDRGEVFITLGAPDESIETTPGTAGRVVRWTYPQLPLVALLSG